MIMGQVFFDSKSRNRVLWFMPPLILWAVIIFPSTFDAVWGSMDDAGALIIARAGFKGNLIASCGVRMIPVYFLNHWLFYVLGGTDAHLWYFFQSLEFLLVVFLIYYGIGAITGRFWVGAMAGSLLLTSSPIAENAFTIGKNESILILFYGFIVFAVATWKSEKIQRGFSLRHSLPIAYFLIFFFIIIFAIFSKETAAAVFFIGISGLAAGYVYRQVDKQKVISLFSVFSLSAIFSILLFLFLRVYVSQPQPGGYTSFFPSLETVSTNFSYYKSQTPDVLLLGILGFVGGLLSLSRSSPRNTVATTFAWGTWVGGWAQFGTLLVWRWPLGYYMLPVAFWFCISLALFMSGMLDAFKISDKLKKRNKQWLAAILAIILISRLYSLPYIHFIAHAQRGFDRQENAIQDKVIELDPIGKRVVDLDRVWFTEQPLQRTRLFNEKGRPDLKWVGAGELFHRVSEEMRRLYNNDSPPDLDTAPLRTGDLVLLQGIKYPFRIMLRGIGGTITDLSDFNGKMKKAENFTGCEFKEVFRLEDAEKVFQPWTFGPKQLIFRSILYKATGRKSVSYRWEGHYGDWIGGQAKLKLDLMEGNPMGTLHIFMPPNSQIVNSVLPLRVSLEGDNNQIKELIIEKKKLSYRVRVSELIGPGKGEIKIAVSKTWRPIDLGINNDTRELSVMAEYISADKEGLE